MAKKITYNVELRPEMFNERYLPYIDLPTRTQIFYGGSSSGKSVFLAQRCVYDVMRGGRNYLIVRQVSTSLRSSTFNEIKKVINMTDEHGLQPVRNLFDINKSEMIITCKNGYQIMFKGLDDVEKVKSITPAKGVITDIWVEEATETTQDDVKQLERRLRGVTPGIPKRIMFSFNPILRSHWIAQKYFANWADDQTVLDIQSLFILKTTYKDNAFLSSDDIRALEDETDPYWRDVYTLGNWGVLGDLVYTNWEIKDLSDVRETFGTWHNGLDFGFNHATGFIRTHYDRTRKTIYVVDEVYERGLTNPEIAAKIKPILGDDYVVCDSAEPKSIQELRNCGINAIPAKKGKDSVRFGIQWLQQQRIIIDKYHCQNFINEIQSYQWKKDRDGNSLNTPVEKNDDLLDALRYAYELGVSVFAEQDLS